MIRSRASSLASYDEEDEENGSVMTGDSSRHTEEKGEQITIAKSEDRAVFYLRVVLFLVLLGVAACISGAVFWYSSDYEQDDFETQYLDHAHKVIEAFKSNGARRLRAIDSLAFGITDYALSSGETWPNVTIPNFERRVQYTLDLAEVLSITFLPIVTNVTREGWEEYSWEHQDWLLEGLALQQAVGEGGADEGESIELLNDIVDMADGLKISPKIIKIEGTGSVNETGPGVSSYAHLSTIPGCIGDVLMTTPFLLFLVTLIVQPFAPWWQFAPAFPFSTIVNYNTMSHPTRVNEITAIIETEQPLVSKAWDYADKKDPETVGRRPVLDLFLNRWREGGNVYEDGPVSDLYVPIFDTFDENRQLVAVLTAYVYWQLYFENIVSVWSAPFACH